MPCGSTDNNSTSPLYASSPIFWDLGRSRKNPFTWLVGMILRWERRQELSKLDDRMLADIGMFRTGVEEVRRSRLYLDAWRDSR